MEYSSLGNTNLRVSRLGFGCSQIHSLSTRHPQAEVRSTLSAAFDAGINFFDTADVYGQGDSERLLARTLGTRRDKVIYCTKAGLTTASPESLIRMMKPFVNPVLRRWGKARRATQSVRNQVERTCFDPAYIRKRIEGSLSRLETDYLDVFMLHSPPPKFVEQGEVIELLLKLKAQGKIRAFGISCPDVGIDKYSYSNTEVSCLQIPVNPTRSDVIHSILPRASTLGIGIMAREPFAGGSLVESPVVRELCSAVPGRTAAGVLLQYALQRKNVATVVCGMTSRMHLEENLAAMSLQRLTKNECTALESAS